VSELLHSARRTGLGERPSEAGADEPPEVSGKRRWADLIDQPVARFTFPVRARVAAGGWLPLCSTLMWCA
jgi:hypothetical protein